MKSGSLNVVSGIRCLYINLALAMSLGTTMARVTWERCGIQIYL